MGSKKNSEDFTNTSQHSKPKRQNNFIIDIPSATSSHRVKPSRCYEPL